MSTAEQLDGGEWTIGHGRLGNAPRDPSPEPLGWFTQRHQELDADDVLQWGPVMVTPLLFDGPDVAREQLWLRRKGRNCVRIPDGFEFDQYGAHDGRRGGCAPIPEMQAARVRVVWTDEKPAGTS